MSKMPRVRQIATEVVNGAITFSKGYNKLLNAIKSVASPDEREIYIQYFNTYCA